MRGWSAIKDDSSEDKKELELFSDKMQRLFSDYAMDTNMRLRPKPGTKRLNLNKLVEMLRSKDESLYQAMFPQGVESANPLFLDYAPHSHSKVALASWPRSGNTFIRKYVELLTGVQSGSDNSLHYNVLMQMLNSKGEEIVDESVWAVKTHYPWIPISPTNFYANRAIVVARNPLDSILSWYHLMSQQNHTTKAPYNIAADYPEFFDWWIKN